MVAGDFNLAFSETWGPPYDPHSYATSWSAPDEAYYAALKGLPAPNTQAVLGQKIAETLLVEGEVERGESWGEILNILHDAATEIPFSGKSIPAVISNRLSGYQPGHQQFDYPVHNLRVVSGSKNLTLSPGAQTGLFTGVGRLDPHSYRPNEFFANNWVYEGLVEYGPDGAILPSLALSWSVTDITGGKQKYAFNLRQGVKFHDGTDWKCSVAKLNLDHVFAKPLTTSDWHGWYGLPEKLESWNCVSDYVLELTSSDSYYPLLQELSYIRPLRMLSPNAFVGGAASDPNTQNSCPTGWGTATLNGYPDVVCAGTTDIAGTGRWKHEVTVMDATGDHATRVDFKRFHDHWDAYGGADGVDFVNIIYYATSADVKAALDNGSLDAVIGDGVMDPSDVKGEIGRGEKRRLERSDSRIGVFLSVNYAIKSHPHHTLCSSLRSSQDSRRTQISLCL
jgi:ABC-type transport system substrate-binding protein